MSAKKPRITVTCGSCGKEFETTETHLNRGRGKHCSRSCGNRATGTKHGHTTKSGQSRTYNSWTTMIQRCTNPKATKYDLYGGAGVSVSDEWRSFDRFLADMGERPEGKTLDRIDGSKGYCKENCRWATPLEQQANLRSNVNVRYRGETLNMKALSRRLGVDVSTLKYRIRKGWPETRWAEPPMITGARNLHAGTARVRQPAGSPTP